MATRPQPKFEQFFAVRRFQPTLTISPDGKTLVFNADHDGDEFHQLYSLPARGGWPEAWTDAPDVQHYVNEHAWSPDGSGVAFAANSRVSTDMDVWIRDVGSGEVRQVFGGGMYSFPAFWSPNGDNLTVLEFRNTTDSSIHLVPVGGGEPRELTPHEDEAVFTP